MPVGQQVAGPVEHQVVVGLGADHEVGGEHVHVGGQGPDVEVVDVDHVVDAVEVVASLPARSTCARSLLQQDPQRLTAEADAPWARSTRRWPGRSRRRSPVRP